MNPQIRREFKIGNEGFGWVVAAFYLAYALFQVPAGYLADRRDVRIVAADCGADVPSAGDHPVGRVEPHPSQAGQQRFDPGVGGAFASD